MDKRKYIYELFRVVSMYSVMYIDAAGNLRIIYCPFPVHKRQYPFDGLNKIYRVEAVKMNLELVDVYIIDGVAYYARDFVIALE